MKKLKRAVALVAPEAHTRQCLCRVLHGLGLEIEVLDGRDLLAALGAGRRFAMLVLAPQGSSAQVRSEVDQMQAFTGRQTPLMLLVSSEQVQAVMSVMTGERNDYLLMPATEEELHDRLVSLYWRWPSTRLHRDFGTDPSVNLERLAEKDAAQFHLAQRLI